MQFLCLKALLAVVGLLAITPDVPTNQTDMGKAYTCPRCRRAEPRGPKRRPTPSAPPEGLFNMVQKIAK